MQARELTFRITERLTESNHVVLVQPCFPNIARDEGGDRILLAIAINCVRLVAKRSGLEAAVDQFNDLILNHTRITRR